MTRALRKAPRTRCRIPCRLEIGNVHATGTVLDVSSGGLSIRTLTSIEPGEALLVRLNIPGEREAINVETLVWHTRRARDRKSGKSVFLLGLMLEKAPASYFELTLDSELDVPVERESKPEVETRNHPPDDAESPALRSFRIRVKSRRGPRTRTLSLDAVSEDEAQRLATQELGGDWEVLEVWAR